MRLFIYDDKVVLSLLSLAHLAPMSIGIEVKVANRNLSLVRNMGGDPGDKLQACLCVARRQVTPLLLSAQLGWIPSKNGWGRLNLQCPSTISLHISFLFYIPSL